MERASVALARMDYLTCEELCVEALGEARRVGDWPYYARILLPLQESRRQRRLIAAEGTIRLGTAGLDNDPARWLAEFEMGCVVVTHPHEASTAARLWSLVRERRLYIEVLYADNDSGSPWWRVSSFRGLPVQVSFPAPRAQWVNCWLRPGADGGTRPAVPDRTGRRAKGWISSGGTCESASGGDWFLDACEALGDAALGLVEPTLTGVERVEALERCLEAAGDHEILHQRLAEAARTIA